VLRQNPSLLNPDREIKLGKLVALKEQKVIEDEIEYAVQVLDRKSVKERAKAFEKLGLPWVDDLDTIERVIILRNRILHEDTNIEVSDLDLGNARLIAMGTPLHLCMTAEDNYPSGFHSGVSLQEMIKWTEQQRALREKLGY